MKRKTLGLSGEEEENSAHSHTRSPNPSPTAALISGAGAITAVGTDSFLESFDPKISRLQCMVLHCGDR